jgi:phosphate transport system substrate-binding protein
MHKTPRGRSIAAALIACAVGTAVFAAVGLAAKKKPLSGTITADGSSTVGPWTTAAAERFQKLHPKVRITVGISGTGGGFERFCRGEIDLADASRPIKQSEAQRCNANDISYVPFHVANDGIAIVVNKRNTWAKCLTSDELKKMWDSGSKVNNWKDVRSSFPDVSLKLYGAGTDSGTFDFFTEKINGKSRRSRSDYTASENDNILVRGVEGERGALGYFGYSYYEENKKRLGLVKVDAGGGCVGPSVKTVQNRTYKPLSRPLFIYAKRDSFRRAEVRAFIGYALNNQQKIAKAADFVWLTKKQSNKSRTFYRNALKRIS